MLSGTNMQAKLRALGGNIEWLMTGTETANVSFIRAPTRIQLVGKIIADPERKGYFEDTPLGTIICFPGDYFALVADGNSLVNAPDGEHSMEISPEEICMFHVGPQPKNGEMVALQLKQSNKRMVKNLEHISRDGIELAQSELRKIRLTI